LLVFGDGPHELGATCTRHSPSGLPALPCLIHRVIGSPVSFSCETRLLKDVGGHVRGKGHGYTKKVIAAILEARRDGFASVAVLVDRDRRGVQDTLHPLQAGRDASPAGCPPCAVGVAVETFDAWMVVDGKAIQAAGGDGSRSHPDPEGMDGVESSGNHPKVRAAEVFGGGEGLGEKYAVVAKHVGIELLKKQCLKGFAPFAKEIEEFVRPAVVRASV